MLFWDQIVCHRDSELVWTCFSDGGSKGCRCCSCKLKICCWFLTPQILLRTHTHTHTHTHIGWRLRSAVESIIQIPVAPQVQQTLSLSPSLTSLCLLFCYATYPQHPLSLLLSLDSSKFIPQSISAWFLSLLYPNLFLYLISSFLSFSFFQCVPKDCFFIIFNQ